MPETSFSGPESSVAPRQFKPGRGQIGEGAALHAGKGERRSDQAPRGHRSGAQPAKIGLPESEPEVPDYRHLIVGLQHQNAEFLGRETPFPIWALRTGRATEWELKPFDWTGE